MEWLKLEDASEDWLVQPLFSNQGQLEQVDQDHASLGLKNLQVWRLHNLCK